MYIIRTPYVHLTHLYTPLMPLTAPMYPTYAAHVPDVGAGADGLGRILGRIQEQVRAP